MTGVIFIVCIPRADHERSLKKLVNEDGRSSARSANDQFGHMKSTVESVVKNGNLAKCRSSESLSPRQGKFDDETKNELFKCKSELNVSGEVEREFAKSPWEGVKRAISPKKQKLRISSPERRCQENLFDHCTPMETILSEVLQRLRVTDAVWCPGKENKYCQVLFSLETGPLSGEAITLLGSFGIGTRYNSVVSVIPCALYYNANATKAGRCNYAHDDGNMMEDRDGKSAWSRFVSSVRARTSLAQLVHAVRTEATLTFDWLFLLVVAAFVAAIGLVENSTVFLVASMLISPLMGPLVAGTVGTVVRDRSLQRMGVVHELIGLLLACVIGFLFGLVICTVDERYGTGDWPTYEMLSRCEVRSLWVGLMVALPSGAGVALAVLGDYTASLVGVAISASLLPPAVNAGLLWAMCLVQLIFSDDDAQWNADVTISLYSDNPAVELAVHGSVSLCLTFVNIVCIYVGGLLAYRIKEVAPMDPKNMRFWRSSAARASPEDVESRSSPESEPSHSGLEPAAWDYFRWCSISERMRLARLTAGTSQHDTWSPYTHMSPPQGLPRAQDIEAYCRRQATKSKTGVQLVNPVTACRPVGQGYAPLTSETSLASVNEDRGTASWANVDERSPTSANTARRKFKVTPAFEPHSESNN